MKLIYGIIILFTFASAQIPDTLLNYDKCRIRFYGDSAYVIIGRRAKERDGKIIIKQDSIEMRCRNNRVRSKTTNRIERGEFETFVSDTVE